MTSVMNEHVKQGMQVKMIISQERLPASSSMPPMPKNFELRGLLELPAIVVLTETVAGICFYQIDGKIDYAGFYGKTPAFHDWVKDLFLYYWEKVRG